MRIIKVKLKKGRIPSKYLRYDIGNTVALMDPNTGYMQGRVLSRKRDDGTKVRRIKPGVDVDGDGISDGGKIYGRTKSIRSSKRARGYVRKI